MALTEMMQMQGVTSEKMSNPVRTLKLGKIREDKPILDGAGAIDNRLFKGENNLECFKEPDTGFWTFRYTNGIVPENLKQKFTSFKMAIQHANSYYHPRNITIKEVID